jgi:tetratricopeptide (TPR) repeat protein
MRQPVRSSAARWQELAGAAGFLLVALIPVGCIKEQLVPPASQVFVNGQVDNPAKEITLSEPDEKPRTPKASSCVALGDWAKSCGDMASTFARKADKPAQRQSYEAQARNFYVQAKARYQQALNVDPNELGAVLGLARVAGAENDFAAAQRHYEQLLAAQPANAALAFEVGLMFARARQWEPALAYLKRASELDPANTTIATTLGWTLARAERLEEAWHTFRPLVGEAQAYFRLAQMAQHLGRKDLTKAYLNFALERDASLEEARVMLANLEQASTTQVTVPEPGAVTPAAHSAPGLR